MHPFAYLITLVVLSYCFVILLVGDEHSVALGEPILKSPEFHLDRIVDGLSRPTGLTFLGPDDFLVIEEDTGKVKRVIDGEVSQTILDLDVSTDDSRGLIGIDSYQNGSKTFVFLYYTESSSSGDGEGDPLGNRLYRYELAYDENSLINPKLLLDLPAGPGSMDNGGPVLIGPDNYLYIVIGQIQDDNEEGHKTKAQNFEKGPDADGTSGVHRITQDGEIVAAGILDPAAEMETYFAYGIRNSFGMDFDPITGNLWLSENGGRTNDEINLIESGFNGGRKDLTGFASTGGLVSFNGTGYSDPKFVWNQTVAPTALLFFNSDSFGPGYKDDIFVV